MDDTKRFYVYAYLRSKDSSNGCKLSPYYIGKGRGPRAFIAHNRRATPPSDKSYIIFIQEGLTEREALDLEKYCIALYGRLDIGTGILRNLTDGGEGTTGWKAPDETRAKMSQSRTGKPLPQKTKDNMSRALLGNKRWLGKAHTQETKEKMAKASVKYLYELTSPSGEVYITDNAKGFARQHNLSSGHLCHVIHGKRNHHKGWTGRIIKELP